MDLHLTDHTDRVDAARKNVENIEHTSLIELAPRKPTEAGSPPVGRESAKRVHTAWEQFAKELEPYHGGGELPFSIISCILGLPEHAGDWEHPERLRQVLTQLLADCGFWFNEMYPTACGQRERRDLASAIVDENNTLHSAYQLESGLQSEAQLDFYRLYSRNGEQFGVAAPPMLVKKLEQIIGPDGEGYFRKYVTRAIQKTETVEDLQGRLEKLWFSLGDIPIALLDIPLKDAYGLDIEDNGGKPITLRQAQRNMTGICKQILEVHKTEVERIYHAFAVSREEYERYKDMLRTRRKLLHFWGDDRAIMVSCKHFPSLLKQRIFEILQRQDSVGNVPKRQSGNTRVLISHFVQQTGQFSERRIKSCANSLCACFCDFFNKIYDAQVLAEMETIIAFSCHEVFCIEDADDPENSNDHHLPMAPVITYLLFCKYSAYLAKGNLKSIGLEAFFDGENPAGLEALPTHLNLYDKICQIYRTLYGKRYTKAVQAEWDAAFLSCSGLCNDGKDFLVFSKAWDKCILDRSLPFPFSCITACLNTNHADLIHDSVIRNRMIKCTDPEICLRTDDAQVFEFFRAKLIQNEDLLSGYLNILKYGNSHGAMSCYLKKCLNIMLLNEAEPEIKLEIHCKEIFEQYHLGNLNIQEKRLRVKIVPMTYCQIVLEYTMRKILFEQCVERLYNWLVFCMNENYEVKRLDLL